MGDNLDALFDGLEAQFEAEYDRRRQEMRNVRDTYLAMARRDESNAELSRQRAADLTEEWDL